MGHKKTTAESTDEIPAPNTGTVAFGNTEVGTIDYNHQDESVPLDENSTAYGTADTVARGWTAT